MLTTTQAVEQQPGGTTSRADTNRRHQDALEAERRQVAREVPRLLTDGPRVEPFYAAVGPGGMVVIIPELPWRCAAAGVGRLHDIRTDADGVRRCAHCRRRAL